MKPFPRLQAAEKDTRLVLSAVSILGQLSEHFDLPVAASLFDELSALARAQRRVLRAAHTQLAADPLLAHLLKDRIAFRHADRHKSGKRLEDMVCGSYYLAQSLGFRGNITDWRKLLTLFPH